MSETLPKMQDLRGVIDSSWHKKAAAKGAAQAKVDDTGFALPGNYSFEEYQKEIDDALLGEQWNVTEDDVPALRARAHMLTHGNIPYDETLPLEKVVSQYRTLIRDHVDVQSQQEIPEGTQVEEQPSTIIMLETPDGVVDYRDTVQPSAAGIAASNLPNPESQVINFRDTEEQAIATGLRFVASMTGEQRKFYDITDNEYERAQRLAPPDDSQRRTVIPSAVEPLTGRMSVDMAFLGRQLAVYYAEEARRLKGYPDNFSMSSEQREEILAVGKEKAEEYVAKLQGKNAHVGFYYTDPRKVVDSIMSDSTSLQRFGLHALSSPAISALKSAYDLVTGNDEKNVDVVHNSIASRLTRPIAAFLAGYNPAGLYEGDFVWNTATTHGSANQNYGLFDWASRGFLTTVTLSAFDPENPSLADIGEFGSRRHVERIVMENHDPILDNVDILRDIAAASLDGTFFDMDFEETLAGAKKSQNIWAKSAAYGVDFSLDTWAALPLVGAAFFDPAPIDASVPFAGKVAGKLAAGGIQLGIWGLSKIGVDSSTVTRMAVTNPLAAQAQAQADKLELIAKELSGGSYRSPSSLNSRLKREGLTRVAHDNSVITAFTFKSKSAIDPEAAFLAEQQKLDAVNEAINTIPEALRTGSVRSLDDAAKAAKAEFVSTQATNKANYAIVDNWVNVQAPSLRKKMDDIDTALGDALGDVDVGFQPGEVVKVNLSVSSIDVLQSKSRPRKRAIADTQQDPVVPTTSLGIFDPIVPKSDTPSSFDAFDVDGNFVEVPKATPNDLNLPPPEKPKVPAPRSAEDFTEAELEDKLSEFVTHFPQRIYSLPPNSNNPIAKMVRDRHPSLKPFHLVVRDAATSVVKDMKSRRFALRPVPEGLDVFEPISKLPFRKGVKLPPELSKRLIALNKGANKSDKFTAIAISNLFKLAEDVEEAIESAKSGLMVVGNEGKADAGTFAALLNAIENNKINNSIAQNSPSNVSAGSFVNSSLPRIEEDARALEELLKVVEVTKDKKGSSEYRIHGKKVVGDNRKAIAKAFNQLTNIKNQIAEYRAAFSNSALEDEYLFHIDNDPGGEHSLLLKEMGKMLREWDAPITGTAKSKKTATGEIEQVISYRRTYDSVEPENVTSKPTKNEAETSVVPDDTFKAEKDKPDTVTSSNHRIEDEVVDHLFEVARGRLLEGQPDYTVWRYIGAKHWVSSKPKGKSLKEVANSYQWLDTPLGQSLSRIFSALGDNHIITTGFYSNPRVSSFVNTAKDVIRDPKMLADFSTLMTKSKGLPLDHLARALQIMRDELKAADAIENDGAIEMLDELSKLAWGHNLIAEDYKLLGPVFKDIASMVGTDVPTIVRQIRVAYQDGNFLSIIRNMHEGSVTVRKALVDSPEVGPMANGSEEVNPMDFFTDVPDDFEIELEFVSKRFDEESGKMNYTFKPLGQSDRTIELTNENIIVSPEQVGRFVRHRKEQMEYLNIAYDKVKSAYEDVKKFGFDIDDLGDYERLTRDLVDSERMIETLTRTLERAKGQASGKAHAKKQATGNRIEEQWTELRKLLGPIIAAPTFRSLASDPAQLEEALGILTEIAATNKPSELQVDVLRAWDELNRRIGDMNQANSTHVVKERVLKMIKQLNEEGRKAYRLRFHNQRSARPLEAVIAQEGHQALYDFFSRLSPDMVSPGGKKEFDITVGKFKPHELSQDDIRLLSRYRTMFDVDTSISTTEAIKTLRNKINASRNRRFAPDEQKLITEFINSVREYRRITKEATAYEELIVKLDLAKKRQVNIGRRLGRLTNDNVALSGKLNRLLEVDRQYRRILDERAALPNRTAAWKVLETRSNLRKSLRSGTDAAKKLDGGRETIKQLNHADKKLREAIMLEDRLEALKARRERIRQDMASVETWRETSAAHLRRQAAAYRAVANDMLNDTSKLESHRELMETSRSPGMSSELTLDEQLRLAIYNEITSEDYHPLTGDGLISSTGLLAMGIRLVNMVRQNFSFKFQRFNAVSDLTEQTVQESINLGHALRSELGGLVAAIYKDKGDWRVFQWLTGGQINTTNDVSVTTSAIEALLRFTRQVDPKAKDFRSRDVLTLDEGAVSKAEEIFDEAIADARDIKFGSLWNMAVNFVRFASDELVGIRRIAEVRESMQTLNRRIRNNLRRLDEMSPKIGTGGKRDISGRMGDVFDRLLRLGAEEDHKNAVANLRSTVVDMLNIYGELVKNRPKFLMNIGNDPVKQKKLEDYDQLVDKFTALLKGLNGSNNRVDYVINPELFKEQWTGGLNEPSFSIDALLDVNAFDRFLISQRNRSEATKFLNDMSDLLDDISSLTDEVIPSLSDVDTIDFIVNNQLPGVLAISRAYIPNGVNADVVAGKLYEAAYLGLRRGDSPDALKAKLISIVHEIPNLQVPVGNQMDDFFFAKGVIALAVENFFHARMAARIGENAHSRRVSEAMNMMLDNMNSGRITDWNSAEHLLYEAYRGFNTWRYGPQNNRIQSPGLREIMSSSAQDPKGRVVRQTVVNELDYVETLLMEIDRTSKEGRVNAVNYLVSMEQTRGILPPRLREALYALYDELHDAAVSRKPLDEAVDELKAREEGLKNKNALMAASLKQSIYDSTYKAAIEAGDSELAAKSKASAAAANVRDEPDALMVDGRVNLEVLLDEVKDYLLQSHRLRFMPDFVREQAVRAFVPVVKETRLTAPKEFTLNSTLDNVAKVTNYLQSVWVWGWMIPRLAVLGVNAFGDAFQIYSQTSDFVTSMGMVAASDVVSFFERLAPKAVRSAYQKSPRFRNYMLNLTGKFGKRVYKVFNESSDHAVDIYRNMPNGDVAVESLSYAQLKQYAKLLGVDDIVYGDDVRSTSMQILQELVRLSESSDSGIWTKIRKSWYSYRHVVEEFKKAMMDHLTMHRYSLFLHHIIDNGKTPEEAAVLAKEALFDWRNTMSAAHMRWLSIFVAYAPYQYAAHMQAAKGLLGIGEGVGKNFMPTTKRILISRKAFKSLTNDDGALADEDADEILRVQGERFHKDRVVTFAMELRDITQNYMRDSWYDNDTHMSLVTPGISALNSLNTLGLMLGFFYTMPQQLLFEEAELDTSKLYRTFEDIENMTTIIGEILISGLRASIYNEPWKIQEYVDVPDGMTPILRMLDSFTGGNSVRVIDGREKTSWMMAKIAMFTPGLFDAVKYLAVYDNNPFTQTDMPLDQVIPSLAAGGFHALAELLGVYKVRTYNPERNLELDAWRTYKFPMETEMQTLRRENDLKK